MGCGPGEGAALHQAHSVAWLRLVLGARLNRVDALSDDEPRFVAVRLVIVREITHRYHAFDAHCLSSTARISARSCPIR